MANKISKASVNSVEFELLDAETVAELRELSSVAVQSVKIGDIEYNVDTVVELPPYPTTLPASDVSEWAKASVKPTYTYTEVGADASGSADSALVSAKEYANSLAINYDEKGAAAGALTLAQSYADSLAVNYDAVGSANTALENAKDYANSLAKNYDVAGSATTALNSAKSYADGLAKNYDASGSASAALSSAKEYTDTEVAKKATKATTLSGYGITDAINSSEKGSVNGVATLGSDGLIPSSQLPSYVDDVLEYANVSSFPAKGESGKIYIDLTENITYRWSGSTYVEISKSLAIGETSSTAYAGDKGKANADAISALQSGKADKATTLSGYGIVATATDVGAIPAEDIKSIKLISEEDYEALIEKDPTVLYLIR